MYIQEITGSQRTLLTCACASAHVLVHLYNTYISAAVNIKPNE